MTPQEAYKIGFQLACVAKGRDAEKVAEMTILRKCLPKQAGFFDLFRGDRFSREDMSPEEREELMSFGRDPSFRAELLAAIARDPRFELLSVPSAVGEKSIAPRKPVRVAGTKQAEMSLAALLSSLGKGVSNLGSSALGAASSLTTPALFLAAAGPPIAGTLGGAAMASAQEPPMSREEIQQDEIRMAYTDAVRRMRKAIEERKQRQKRVA